MEKTPASEQDKYVLRFTQPGHRDRLKAQAAIGRRSLNQHLLLLIEEGEKAVIKEPTP